MPNARKQSSGNWRCKAKYKGQAKSFTAPTKREAELLASQWVNGLKDGDNGLSLDEALTKYIASKEGVCSPSTIRGYEQIRTCYFGEIGRLKLSGIDSYTLQNFVSNLALNRSPKTVRNVYGLLVSTLKMFIPERSFDITLPQKVPIQRTVPTDDQINTLLENAKDDLKIAILLGSFGLRRGEVCALTFDDVYPDLGFIQINKDMIQNKNKEWVVKPTPKTSSSCRVVRMPREIIDQLGHGSGRVYPYNPNSLTQAFTRLRDRLQINVSFHSLRRYMASILHALGFPDKYIQEVGGWSTPQVMQKCYESILVDKNVEYTKKMGEYYTDKFARKA